MLLNVYNRFDVTFVKGKGIYLYEHVRWERIIPYY